MDSTTSQPKYKCHECGQPIVGAFWSSIKGERKDYHVQCKPIFYFMHGAEIPTHPKDYRVRKAVT